MKVFKILTNVLLLAEMIRTKCMIFIKKEIDTLFWYRHIRNVGLSV